jgi:signal transduction histidine kinase
MNNLLNRTLFTLLFSAITIVGLSSVLQFFWIKAKIEKRVDKTLIREKGFIKKQLKDLKPTKGFSYNTNRASVKIISEHTSLAPDSIYNGSFLVDNELINYRVLQTIISIDDQHFKIEIRKEIEETNTFIDSLYFTYFLTLLLIVILFVLFKYFLLKNTWLPFFKTLKTLKYSDLQNQQVTFSSNVKIQEFRELNNELTTLAAKIFEEYQSQKKFIENLNHELMTPIAIIRAKLELIIQSEHLKKNDLKLVSDIFMTIDRLTKLNKSLILISKIENNQFEDVEEVSLLSCINEVLNSFEDQIRVKEIRLRKEVKSDKIIVANEMLIFVLLSNLIKNAIFHNLDLNGTIEIELTSDFLLISNSGKMNKANFNVFDRFVSAKKSENSIGLGLSIVERICNLYFIEIDYTQSVNKHSFKLVF